MKFYMKTETLGWVEIDEGRLRYELSRKNCQGVEMTVDFVKALSPNPTKTAAGWFAYADSIAQE